MTTEQVPLHSGFTAASTAADVIAGIDLRGKTALVTGGASGLGVETVRALASAGAAVVVPAREIARATETLAGVDGVEVGKMDLLDPASIDKFADGFLATARPLQILIDSAGIMAGPLMRDARGYESHFATNHLGHFQLAARLWPALAGAGGARVVSVSSWGHRYSTIHFSDINFEHREYEPLQAYGQSKTANVLFAVELDRRGEEYGVRAFSLHPGSAYTPLARHTSEAELLRIGVLDHDGKPIIDPSRNLKSVAQGAATSVWCATSPQLDGLGGVYCENSDIAPLRSGDRPAPIDRDSSLAQGVMPYAVDRANAVRLWSVSERMLGITFL
jgi:NAD(P)-dependent dehydrogenase (short-subunit alcohol dehydrogenase family)